MDQYSSMEACAVFNALGDPTRMAMLQHLSRGEATANELAKPLDITLTATLKHLRILEQAKLAKSVKVGRERRCAMIPDSLETIERWVEETRKAWSFRLDNLERFLRLPEEER